MPVRKEGRLETIYGVFKTYVYLLFQDHDSCSLLETAFAKKYTEDHEWIDLPDGSDIGTTYHN